MLQRVEVLTKWLTLKLWISLALWLIGNGVPRTNLH